MQPSRLTRPLASGSPPNPTESTSGAASTWAQQASTASSALPPVARSGHAASLPRAEKDQVETMIGTGGVRLESADGNASSDLAAHVNSPPDPARRRMFESLAPCWRRLRIFGNPGAASREESLANRPPRRAASFLLAGIRQPPGQNSQSRTSRRRSSPRWLAPAGITDGSTSTIRPRR